MLTTTNQVFLIPEPIETGAFALGKGLKGIMVIVDSETFLEEEASSLEKIMTALGYDHLEDMFLIRLTKDQNISLGSYGMVYKYIILFGILPEQIGFNLNYEKNKILKLDQSKLLICESMRNIIAVQQKKLVLWNTLKEMFNK